ncbi:hypothetical protein JYU34_006525 [Plutella xylostella]|uniref:Uncharacterized protein n=1 Tax=Plutella xylostella TaxID=51655 RepID=A0ABQ7QS87_PLUXY|nr:hypothetical protein JYU34_006525 [Plutella xylostella]
MIKGNTTRMYLHQGRVGTRDLPCGGGGLLVAGAGAGRRALGGGLRCPPRPPRLGGYGYRGGPVQFPWNWEGLGPEWLDVVAFGGCGVFLICIPCFSIVFDALIFSDKLLPNKVSSRTLS